MALYKTKNPILLCSKYANDDHPSLPRSGNEQLRNFTASLSPRGQLATSEN